MFPSNPPKSSFRSEAEKKAASDFKDKVLISLKKSLKEAKKLEERSKPTQVLIGLFSLPYDDKPPFDNQIESPEHHI